MSSSLPLSFTFNTPSFHRSQSPSDPNLSPIPIISKPYFRSPYKSHICFAISPSNNSNYEREEARWLREEQRWLREEQRWLRQEERWNAERDSLVREISALSLRIQELERQNPVEGTNIAALLQVLKADGELGKNKKVMNQITESGSSAVPMVVEATSEAAEEVVVKEVVRVLEREGNEGIKEVKKRATLRTGSEGDEVRAMQEALQQLGFYSGEEDIEFSSFSSGTERAVKTWQATLDVPEDGIMTAELLERLYIEQNIGGFGLTVTADPKGNDATVPQMGVNGVAFTSITEISEIQKTVVKEEGVAKVNESHERVFLLGENRWEDPSRLSGHYKHVGGAKSRDATKKCITCRGEGRLLCLECDGTGEPNIEPQFMEWVDEGMKCPYCEGHGYTVCDVCEGTTLIK